MAVEIEPKAGKVGVWPLIGSNHGEGVFSTNAVEVVGVAYGGLEVNVGLVDQLVPVEVLDGGDVFFAHLDEFLLEVALDLGDATRLEGGEIIGDDFWAQGGDCLLYTSPSPRDRG